MNINISSTKRDNNMFSSLHSTVKKHNIKQIHHAKSYDNLLILHELDPTEVKVLLNNDKSLKLIKNNYININIE